MMQTTCLLTEQCGLPARESACMNAAMWNDCSASCDIGISIGFCVLPSKCILDGNGFSFEGAILR